MSAPTPQHPNEAKFAELLLYVAKRSRGDALFGAIKLNKVLFYADFEAYKQLGVPITGVPYQNLEHGPAPKRLLPAQEELVDAGSARVDFVPTPLGVQKRLVALRDPDLSSFSKEELAIVNRVLNRLRSKTAKEASDESHEEVGWLVTSVGETIPYHMALLSRPTPGPDDVTFVEKLAADGHLHGTP